MTEPLPDDAPSTEPLAAVSADETIRNIKAKIRPSYYEVYHGVDSVMNADLYGRIAAEVHAICAGL